MYWILLVLGVALWWAAHLFKRIAPARREAMGNAGAGLVAALLVLSMILMTFGYRSTDFVAVWSPPSFMIHLNNLLILIAIFMMSPAGRRGKVLSRLRHPMATGFGLWALAHLLVNGDLAAILLFGGLLFWVILTVRILNAATPNWTPRTDGTYAKDAMFLGASVVLMGIIGYIHFLLGYWPFPG